MCEYIETVQVLKWQQANIPAIFLTVIFIMHSGIDFCVNDTRTGKTK